MHTIQSTTSLHRALPIGQQQVWRWEIRYIKWRLQPQEFVHWSEFPLLDNTYCILFFRTQLYYEMHCSYFFSCRMYRYVAYRRFVRWIWHRLGKNMRRILPSCVVTVIRNTFPSEEYTGFKYAVPWDNCFNYLHEIKVIFWRNVTCVCLLNLVCQTFWTHYWQPLGHRLLCDEHQLWPAYNLHVPSACWLPFPVASLYILKRKQHINTNILEVNSTLSMASFHYIRYVTSMYTHGIKKSR